MKGASAQGALLLQLVVGDAQSLARLAVQIAAHPVLGGEVEIVPVTHAAGQVLDNVEVAAALVERVNGLVLDGDEHILRALMGEVLHLEPMAHWQEDVGVAAHLVHGELRDDDELDLLEPAQHRLAVAQVRQQIALVHP